MGSSVSLGKIVEAESQELDVRAAPYEPLEIDLGSGLSHPALVDVRRTPRSAAKLHPSRASFTASCCSAAMSLGIQRRRDHVGAHRRDEHAFTCLLPLSFNPPGASVVLEHHAATVDGLLVGAVPPVRVEPTVFSATPALLWMVMAAFVVLVHHAAAPVTPDDGSIKEPRPRLYLPWLDGFRAFLPLAVFVRRRSPLVSARIVSGRPNTEISCKGRSGRSHADLVSCIRLFDGPPPTGDLPRPLLTPSKG